MDNAPAPTTNCSIWDALDCTTGAALDDTGQSIDVLLAAIAGSAGSFAAQLFIFALLRLRLKRIYRPRSFLVPERERVEPPPRGIVAWLAPLFTTTNLTFIQKCGLDAYFFLRYLRMLLKFFLPVALVVLPILLPLNRYSGGGSQGLDKLSINNVAPRYVANRLWAHLILAIGIILWFCYVVYKELRGYIRVRQAFLTSPQHRIRASATTVLVTGIPPKWLTHEALAGLYDVFPGGIKNIWINRNFDSLASKVDERQSVAKDLEAAETNLIKLCQEKHAKQVKQQEKKAGVKKSKDELKQEQAAGLAAAEQMAESEGVTAGDSQNTPHGLQDVLNEAHEHDAQERQKQRKRKAANLGVVGQGLDRVGLGAVNQGLGQGLGAVGHGFGAIGKGVGTLGQRVVGDVDAGFHWTGNRINNTIDAADAGGGFVMDDEVYRQSVLSQDSAPTPPPKSPAMLQEQRSVLLEESSQMDGLRSVGQRRGPPGVAGARLPAASSPTFMQHPMARKSSLRSQRSQPAAGSPNSDRTLGAPSIRMTRPSGESRPKSSMQIEEPEDHRVDRSPWKFWKSNDRSLNLPSPQPHTADEDEFPLNATTVPAKTPKMGVRSTETEKDQHMSGSKWTEKLAFWKSGPPQEYPPAFNDERDEDEDEKPRWRRYLEAKDRETTRLPVQSWLPSLPLIGKKVDKIYHLRRELARLNLEIEIDQNNVDNFEYMNSAFIQFNHQVAAHMACQSLSHHVPQHMAPRLVEISPDDVEWGNMAIKWWERYIRTGIVLVACVGLIVLYAIPVTFTSLLSKLDTLAATYAWLSWVADIPSVVKDIIQGLLPALLLNLILLLTPIIFRALVRFQGQATGAGVELGVQGWYFAFLFIQVFFVVTISSGLTEFFTTLAGNPGKVVKSLATSLPKGADYFFSYLLVQALASSAGALLQSGSLLAWFILAPLLDSTARAKWRRETSLNKIQWGSFYPAFTNFAVIGIIYSAIAPFILVFMLIIFALFWIVYRYNVLYVYQFRVDTGGLLFPVAINQLFTGVYFLEICLVGYFFISTDENGNVACIPQGAIMIVAVVFTIVYQWQLNASFSPLFQYLPITLDDEAVLRDEAFAKAQASKFEPLTKDIDGNGIADDEQDIQEVLERREQQELDAERAAEAAQRKQIAERKRSGAHRPSQSASDEERLNEKSGSIAANAVSDNKRSDWRRAGPDAFSRLMHPRDGHRDESTNGTGTTESRIPTDVEAQKPMQGDILYEGFADELEDLSPHDRDLLVQLAFKHSALRARRPVVWIPRDHLGVSDDEIRRAEKMSTMWVPSDLFPDDDEKVDVKGGKVKKTNIWMSNQGTGLSSKGKVIFRKSPPDFSNLDLIAL